MRRIGRPTKYHDERCDVIIQTLRQGNTKRVAYLMGGIKKATFYEWCEKYPDFADAIEKAEAEAEQLHVVNIRTHSGDNWQASAWWLERRRNDDWRKPPEKHHVSGDPDNKLPIAVEYVVFKEEEGDE